jgi:hypothetical protein
MSSRGQKKQVRDLGAAPAAASNKQTDQKELEPLTGAAAKDAEPLIEAFGQRPVQCIFSKQWPFREEGFDAIAKSLTAAELDKVTQFSSKKSLTFLKAEYCARSGGGVAACF